MEMKVHLSFFKIITLLGLLHFSISACKSESNNSPKKNLSSKSITQYSEYLDITETKNYIQISIVHPDTKKKYEYVISIKPIDGTSGTWVQPRQKLAVMSSTHIGMLNEIDETKRIVAISNSKYLYNPKLIRRKNQLINLGDEGQIPINLLVKSKAKNVVYSGFGESLSNQESLDKLKITAIPDFDWRETHPLGKAEWLLLFGALTGKFEKAKKQLVTIKANYFKTKSEVKKLNIKQRVMSGNLTADVWYTPAGGSYFARIMKDAGMNYRYATTKGTGSLGLGLEKVVNDAKNVEIWINPGASSFEELEQLNPKSRHFSSFKNKLIFCYSKNANRFWEESAVRPDLVLRDLALINSGVYSSNLLTYYSKLK